MFKNRFVYREENKDDGSANNNPPAITAEQFAAVQESVAKLEAKNKELLQEKAEAKKAADKATEEAARKSGDITSLEKSWQEKLNNEVSARDSKLAAYQQTISNMTAGTQARSLAAELSIPGSADVLLPHIEKRLRVELTDDAPIVRILDASGKPSAMSMDDLKKEIMNNPAFAPLLIGSKASGAGDAGNKGSKPQGKTMSRADFDRLSPNEQDKFVSDGGKPIDA